MLDYPKWIDKSIKGLGLLYAPGALFAKKSKKISKMLMNSIVMEFSKLSSNYYYKYLRFDKKILDVTSNSSIDNVAIIIQGPVLHKNEFTINTALRYKKLYPNIEIVISTWDNEPQTFFERCDDLGIKYLKNSFPSDIDKINTHYQVYSTRECLKVLSCNSKIQFVLKTRTDQRLYSECFVENLLNFSKTFSINNQYGGLNSRIIFMNADASTYQYYAYHLSDMLVFGDIRDLLKMYSIPLNSEGINRKYEEEHGYDEIVNKIRELEHCKGLSEQEIYNIIPNYDEFINYKIKVVSELYIIYEFIGSILNNRSLQNHFSTYRSFLKDAAIVLDKEMLELYWPKYINEYWQVLDSQKFGYLTFANWLEVFNS